MPAIIENRVKPNRVIPVSVVIPLYNGGKYIRETVESILAQTVLPKEIIVVNDGSVDGSLELLKSYPVIIVNQQNGGISSARNTGIRSATCQWVALLDQDDVWCEDKLSSQWDAISGDDHPDFIFSDISLLSSNPAQQDTSPFNVVRSAEQAFCSRVDVNISLLDSQKLCAAIMNGNTITPSTVLVKREKVIAAGMFDERMVRAEDRDLFLRLLPLCKVAFIHLKLIRYRLHDGNNSLDNMKMMLGSALLTDKILSNRAIYPEPVYDYIKLSAYDTFYDTGSLALCHNQISTARRYLGRSLREKFRLKACIKMIYSLLKRI